MKIEVKCAYCGKIEYVNPSRAKKYKCCSVECLGKYNSIRYNKKVTLTCPICGKEYKCKQSKLHEHRTCGDKICRHEWLSKTRTGKGNFRYKTVNILLKENSSHNSHDKSKTIYMHVVKEIFNICSVKKLPKGYIIHHKDGNHENNAPENLILIDKSTHSLIHRYFGNVLINALHTNKISKEFFFSLCNKAQKDFYSKIIDVNITNQILTDDFNKTINNNKYIYYDEGKIKKS